jgi:hypothetical protein
MSKRIELTIIICVLIGVFCSTLVGYSPVNAASSSPGPSVTQLSGDTSFSFKMIEPGKLEGAYLGSRGYYLPTGFPQGEKQFSGKALEISGVSLGTQKTCFPFANYPFGWRGSIYQWNGNSWLLLETTVSPGMEGNPAQACAITYGDGVYALITGYSQALAPKKTVVQIEDEVCIEDLETDGWDTSPSTGTFYLYPYFPGPTTYEEGYPFTWKIEDIQPAGLLSPTSGHGTIAGTFDFHSYARQSLYFEEGLFLPGIVFSFTYKMYMPECHVYYFSHDVPVD